MFITAAQSPHLYLYLAKGPYSPGLILAMVGPELVYEMPKETAATCEQQSERGAKGIQGRSSRQNGISEGPETPLYQWPLKLHQQLQGASAL